MSDAKPGPKKQHDYAILGGPTEDGQGAQLVRIRGDEVSVGEIRPARDGEPITHSELVRLHPVDPERRLCRVEVLHAPPEPEKDLPEPQEQAQARHEAEGPRAALSVARDGRGRPEAAAKSRGSDAPSRPARVATDRYRKNWDAIFDKRRKTWDVN